MDLRETTFWVRRLFPGQVRVVKRGARFPARRHRRARPGVPVRVAEFSLYDVSSSGPESLPDLVGDVEEPFVLGGDVGQGDGSGLVPRPEIAACTVDLGRVDYGLRTADGGDVRVELFLVAYPDSVSAGGDAVPAAPLGDSVVARIVAGAAALVADDPEASQPTPGSVIPDAVSMGLGARDYAGSGITTPHVLCVVPYVWPDGVPTITEQPGRISLHESDAATDPFPDHVTGGARLTTVTQLVPITDGEYAFADAHGTQALMGRLADADADLRDLGRECVIRPRR